MTLARREDVQPAPTAPAPFVGASTMGFEQTMSLAKALVQSQLIPVKRPEEALAIILKGKECGFAPMESFEFINIIKGKPSVTPRGHLAQIYRSGLLESLEIIESDEGQPIACTVIMQRKGGKPVKKSFSLAEAQKANLVKDDSAWKGYPRQMCQWRALGFAQDVCFPELSGSGFHFTAGGQMYHVDETPPTEQQRVETARPIPHEPQQPERFNPGTTEIHFGKFQGTPWGELKSPYLTWLIENGNDEETREKAQIALQWRTARKAEQRDVEGQLKMDGQEVQQAAPAAEQTPEWIEPHDNREDPLADLRIALQDASWEEVRRLARDVDVDGLRLVVGKASQMSKSHEIDAEQTAEINQAIRTRKVELGIITAP